MRLFLWHLTGRFFTSAMLTRPADPSAPLHKEQKKKDSLRGAFSRDSKTFDLNVRRLLTMSPAGCGPRRGPDVDPSLITEKLPPAVLELQTAGAWESRRATASSSYTYSFTRLRSVYTDNLLFLYRSTEM